MKQMFDISEKLISEQSDEIYGVNTINWEDSSWKYLSLVGDEEVTSLSHTMVYVFSDSVSCLGKVNENPQSNYALENRLTWLKSSTEYRALDNIDGEPMEFEWNIFTGFTTLQLVREVQEFLSKLSVQPEEFTGRIILMSTFSTISWESQEKKQEVCEAHQKSLNEMKELKKFQNSTFHTILVTLYAKRFSPGKWSFLGTGSEKKWYSPHEYKPQREWDKLAEQMMMKFAESGHPVFRSTSPLSRGVLKSKGGGKLSTHFCADGGRFETVFRTWFLLISSVFTEQFRICVKNVKPAMSEQGDLLWQDNLTHCLCQV